jgi:hypothetical protein
MMKKQEIFEVLEFKFRPLLSPCHQRGLKLYSASLNMMAPTESPQPFFKTISSLILEFRGEDEILVTTGKCPVSVPASIHTNQRHCKKFTDEIAKTNCW